MNIPARNFYIFKSSAGAQVKVLRGDDPPTMTDGIGGWTVVDRPRRVSLTQWTGYQPWRMDVPILFDGYRDNVSVERDIRVLAKMGQGLDFSPPSTIKIQGAVPVVGATWVIDSIDYGTNVYWDQSPKGQFYRLRQDAVVHLLQYEAEQRMKITLTKNLPNIYVVNKQGETLRKIAKTMYGNAKQWKKIQKANPGVRDPNKIPLKTHLRIP